MTAKVFIDGEAGTTGLQIRARLAGREDVALIHLDDGARKDAGARKEALAAADVAILCLPDDAARDAVAFVDALDDPSTRLIDASTAHRVDSGWIYGFAEMTPDQSMRIADARRVSNPGCYAQSAVALLRPLVASDLLPDGHPVTINAVSGYSGGGKSLIRRMEETGDADAIAAHFYVYGLGLEHKHVPEIEAHALLARRPLFAPSVGRFRQGMIVQVPLHLANLPGRPTAADLRDCLAAWYAGRRFVTVAGEAESAAMETLLDAETHNGTNQLTLHVFGNDARGHAVLAAVSDNLGKGAAGAAVQSLNLMLGFDEAAGLEEPLAAA